MEPESASIHPLEFKPVKLLLKISPENSILDKSELQTLIQTSIRRSMGSPEFHLELAGKMRVTLREQEVNLYIYEGQDDQGVETRQIISDPFDAPSGPVILFISGPIQTWQPSVITQFFHSINLA